MKFLRYIFSHLLLILLLMIFGLAIYHRQKVFTKQVNNEFELRVLEFSNFVGIDYEPNKTEALTENSAEYRAEEVSEDVLEKDVAEEVTEENLEEAVVEEIVETDTAVAESDEMEKTVNTEIFLETNESEVTAENVKEKVKENVDSIVEVIVPKADERIEISHFDLINQARLAYQMGKVDVAISLYDELVEIFPEDANVHGELGNIYFNKGDLKKASQYYYSAAGQLINQQNRQQLYQLYRVIHGIDKQLADKLLKQIEH